MRIALAWVDLADPTDRAVAVNLARELSLGGDYACLVGPRRRSREPFKETIDGTTLYRVGPDEEHAVSQLARIHSQEAIDVWHCHVFARELRALTRAARSGKWRMLVTLHLILKDYLRFVAGAAGLSGLLRQAGHVTAVSSATREEFLGAFPGWRRRSSVVYNGPGEALDSMEAKELKPYILCAARLAPYKGQDILLMAFAQLARERPDLRLVLCGRDQTRGGVSRLIRALRLQDRVVLTGDLPPARVQGLMRGCEFFVLPSRRENFPMAILEAMRAGKAVVASAAGGVPEMLRHGIEGLLAPPGDVESLARSMRELARDLKRRARLGARARKRSRLFTWAVAAGSYRRLYEGLTARARSCAGMRSKK